MKNLFRTIIEKRLGGFENLINSIDQNEPMNLKESKKVAVIGAGIAGMSAATLLAERGFEVDIYERDNFLGGKVGSWPHTFSDSYSTNVEHGFHAFFRQYYNLRRILGKVGADRNLIPIDDYYILTQDYGNFSFKKISSVPILNLLSMLKTKIFTIKDIVFRLKINQMMALLEYNREKTFAAFDSITFEEYARAANLPDKMRLMFTTFSRAFFAEPHLISMAELIKSFHFYFLSNDHGLIYDVLDDDFEISLWQPLAKYLENFKVNIYTNSPVDKISKKNDVFHLKDNEYQYVVMGTDIPGTQNIIANSAALKKSHKDFADQISKQKISQKYAVLRIWIDKNTDRQLPFFIFTDALEILDSVTIYHQMEKSSAKWVEKNGGGIFELHSYALPEGWDDRDAIRDQFLKEFEIYFPELSGYKIKYEYLQVREDFTAFHTNLYANRPEPVTAIPGLYLCGDWIKLPVPAMLMEAAATSAIIAVNDILKKERLQEEPVYSVPRKGLFA
jgi:carotenoid phi-ring synthase / carotenoid chi-ring synthase